MNSINKKLWDTLCSFVYLAIDKSRWYTDMKKHTWNSSGLVWGGMTNSVEFALHNTVQLGVKNIVNEFLSSYDFD